MDNPADCLNGGFGVRRTPQDPKLVIRFSNFSPAGRILLTYQFELISSHDFEDP
jgi:hypothetical protein